MLSDALIGMYDVASVRDMVKGLADFRKHLKLSPRGHEKFTEAQAFDYQHRQIEYANATTLLVVDAQTNVVTRHARPARLSPRAGVRLVEATT